LYQLLINIKKHMKRIVLGGLMIAALALFAPSAFAAPGDSGSGNGGCVDNLYGNATNERPGGSGVLPSQSPGPFVNTGFNEPPRDDRTMGLSVGDVMQIGTAAGLTGQETMEIICTFP
jgi:hypothetical protein